MTNVSCNERNKYPFINSTHCATRKRYSNFPCEQYRLGLNKCLLFVSLWMDGMLNSAQLLSSIQVSYNPINTRWTMQCCRRRFKIETGFISLVSTVGLHHYKTITSTIETRKDSHHHPHHGSIIVSSLCGHSYRHCFLHSLRRASISSLYI